MSSIYFIVRYFLFGVKKIKIQFYMKVSKYLCPNFLGSCSDFRQINTFGGVLTPPCTPSSYTTVYIDEQNAVVFTSYISIYFLQ